jgi:hypothetical protein
MSPHHDVHILKQTNLTLVIKKEIDTDNTKNSSTLQPAHQKQMLCIGGCIAEPMKSQATKQKRTSSTQKDKRGHEKENKT